MKCNLAQMWKYELTRIEERKKKEQEKENIRVTTSLIESLKKQGWEFENLKIASRGGYTDVTAFKSPRMEYSSEYDAKKDCLLTLEAKRLAWKTWVTEDRQIGMKDLTALTDFYLCNPSLGVEDFPGIVISLKE